MRRAAPQPPGPAARTPFAELGRRPELAPPGVPGMPREPPQGQRAAPGAPAPTPGPLFGGRPEPSPWSYAPAGNKMVGTAGRLQDQGRVLCLAASQSGSHPAHSSIYLSVQRLSPSVPYPLLPHLSLPIFLPHLPPHLSLPPISLNLFLLRRSPSQSLFISSFPSCPHLSPPHFPEHSLQSLPSSLHLFK